MGEITVTPAAAAAADPEVMEVRPALRLVHRAPATIRSWAAAARPNRAATKPRFNVRSTAQAHASHCHSTHTMWAIHRNSYLSRLI